MRCSCVSTTLPTGHLLLHSHETQPPVAASARAAAKAPQSCGQRKHCTEMAAFAAEYRAPPGWSVDGLALMAARSAVERAAIACARSRLDGDNWVGALDLLSADTLAPYASMELECGAADVALSLIHI